MKLSHNDHQEIVTFVEWLKKKYEVEGLNKIKATIGKVHGVLGITLDLLKPGEVTADMKKNVEDTIEDFSTNLNNYKIKTPAGFSKIKIKIKQEFHTMA